MERRGTIIRRCDALISVNNFYYHCDYWSGWVVGLVEYWGLLVTRDGSIVCGVVTRGQRWRG